MNNSSFNPKKHLNNSKLHLNEKGSYKLNRYFVDELKSLRILLYIIINSIRAKFDDLVQGVRGNRYFDDI